MYHIVKTFIISILLSFSKNFGAASRGPLVDKEYVYQFDKAFLEEARTWRSCDMYVLSPELDPALTYRVEINEEGVFFRRVSPQAEKKVPILLMRSNMRMLDYDIEDGGLTLSASGYDIGSSSAHYRAKDYIEFEWLTLTSKSDLFCVINNPSSVLRAFRVLFNPEPRRASAARLPSSTITMQGKISAELASSELYIHGVRWVQIAISPRVVCEMLGKKFLAKE